MPFEVAPSEISAVVPLSQPLRSPCLTENNEVSYGFISKNGLWLYLVNGTSINIHCTESGKWLGGHCFKESLSNPSARIEAAIEFISSHLPSTCLLLAVNQDDESLVCIFDIDLCQVIRSVLIPDRVTSLEVVSALGGACVETKNLNHKLRYMFGIVAVGTLYGRLFFLDLCLDENFGCDELLPNITTVVKQQDLTALKREAAIVKKQHIFLHMNAESSVGNSFEFKSRNNTHGRFPNGEVCVTTIKYMKSLTSIAVGFNFGGIQLWDIHELSLLFTISSDQHEQSIVGFAFQEPENDPRNFCYLWVVKGRSIKDKIPPDTVSVASLYSLIYGKREYIERFGTLYTEHQSCSKRFEMPLTNNALHSFYGSRLISCMVVSQKDEAPTSIAASFNESDLGCDDMSFCFLSWQVWPADPVHTQPSCYMAVFDLNQWYQAHMPSSVRCSGNELSPFLGSFCLDRVANSLNYKEILGFYTIPQSVKRFKSLLVSEEFFYPSSLNYQLLCFAKSGLCKATYFGLQKQLLFKVADLGPKALLNSKDLFCVLTKCGLITDIHSGTDKTPVVQKEAILQLALEYHLPFFFMKCLKEWRYSESIHEYCTSKALLSWAWKRVMHIKLSIDKLSLPLFNYTGIDIDRESLKQLFNFKKQLSLIDTIMGGYLKFVTPKTEQGLEELQCRRDAISSIQIYLQVMLWLRSVHVIPEVFEELCAGVAYRFSYLNDLFSLKRAKLKQLHCSLSGNDVLLIDGIVKESGISSSWQEKGGSGLYPPPSIYAALSCYLLDGISLESKHVLMYYVLLDMRDTNGDTNFVNELKKFPVVFGLSKSMEKLVKAFLYLDRQNCERAIRKLLHPAVKASDILPWQHQQIIKSFLYWRAPQTALKYIVHMDPPQNTLEEMKMLMSVLLACGAPTQAYEYQHKRQNGYGHELLNHLFLGCQEMNKMKELMYLPLNKTESSTLVQFLSESRDPWAHEHLVVYHLLHCKFFEAMKVNEKLSRALLNKVTTHHEAMVYERTVDRDALVESLMAAISKPEKGLVEEMKRFPLEMVKKEEMPQPLSISVKNNTVKKSTYSDILQSLINKGLPGERWNNPPSRAKTRGTCLEDLPLLCPPITPESNKLSMHSRSSNSAIAKRSLLVISPTEFASPAKKSRLLDSAPFQSSTLTKRKTPRSLAGDIMSLLQTPSINRRNSSSKSSVASATSKIKPQSILKKKDAKQLSFHTASTPPLLSDGDSSDEVMQVDEKKLVCESTTEAENSSRQIRFDLPKSPSSERSPKQDSVLKKQSIKTSLFASNLEEDFLTPRDSYKETAVSSVMNLTREPLSSYRKKSSCRSPQFPTTQQETHMEVEISKKQSLGLSSSEISAPMETFAPDSSIVTSRKSIHFSEESPVVKVVSANDISTLPKDQSYHPPNQRSKESSHSPFKCDFDNESWLNDQQVTLVTESELALQSLKDTVVDNKDIPPKTPTNDPSMYLTLEQTSLEHCDTDMFCSPCGELETDIRAPLPLVEPKVLFEDIIFENTNIKTPEDDIRIKDPSEEDLCKSDKPNKTIEFKFNEPSTISIVNIENISSLEMPNKLQFSFSEPSILAKEPVSDSETSIPVRDIVPQQNVPFTFSEPSNQDISVVNKEDATSTGEQERTFTFSEPSILSTEVSNNIPGVEVHSSVTELSSHFTPTSIRPSRIFIFSKATPSDKNKNDDSKLQTPMVNPQVTKPAVKLSEKGISTSTLTESSLEVSKMPPKHRFTFSKNTPEQSTSSLLKEKKLSESFLSTTIKKTSETNMQSVTEQAQPKSRRTFVFSASSPINEHSVAAKDVEMKSSYEGHAKSRTEFSKSAAENVKIRSSFSKVQDKKVEVQSTTKEAYSSAQSITAVSKLPPKNRFTFSEPKQERTESDNQILKDSSVAQTNQSQFCESADVPGRKKSTKTFVFSMPTPQAKRSTTKPDLAKLKETSENQSNSESEFLKSAAKTYEEFSNLLQTNTLNDGAQQIGEKKQLLSSPSTSIQEESHSESKTQSSSVSESGIQTTAKKMAKKMAKKGSGLEEKRKVKRKVSNKIEFSFAEPHSPATLEILEVLAKTPEQPLPSFMFSPPLTRHRLRQKKINETMESFFGSVALETSFATTRIPPMDPLLEGIMQESKLEPKKRSIKSKPLSQTRSAIKKPTSIRESRNQSRLDASEKSLLLATTFTESLCSPSQSNQSTLKDPSIRHSMVLRQTKAKPKPDNIF